MPKFVIDEHPNRPDESTAALNINGRSISVQIGQEVDLDENTAEILKGAGYPVSEVVEQPLENKEDK